MPFSYKSASRKLLLPRPTHGCPIMRLPDELIYIIFRMTWGDGNFRWVCSSRIAAIVCRRWRSIAINSPLLWTDILFEGEPPFTEQALWIQRSKNAPLHIAIEDDPYHIKAPYTPEDISEIMDVIGPHVFHWRSLETSCLEESAFAKLFDPLRWASAPLLEVLNLANCLSEIDWKFEPFGVGAPRLRELTIGCGGINIHAPVFSHLSKLHLESHSSDSISYSAYDILFVVSQASGTLEDLVIQGCSSIGTSPVILPVHLAKLTNLTLERGWGAASRAESYSEEWWIREFLAGIRVPNLRYPHPDLHSNTLHYLIESSSFPFLNLCTLDLLHDSPELPIPPIPKSSFVGVLSQLPNLRHLHIINTLSVDLEILTYLAPRLRTLEIMGGVRSAPQPPAVKHVVLARQESKHLTPLLRVELKRVELPQGDVGWLKDNVKKFSYRV